MQFATQMKEKYRNFRKLIAIAIVFVIELFACQKITITIA